MFEWSSWRTILPLVLGGVGLVAFALYELRVPTYPMVPLIILHNRTAAAAFLGTFLMGIVNFGLLYYLPLYYQIIKGYNPLLSGVALLPQCLLCGPTTAFTGVYISKTGRYRIVIWTGWILLALGCGLLVLLDVETTVVQWIFLNIVSGFGLGALFTSQSVASQAATDDKHKAIVSGLTPFFRTVGQALGIVICGTVFQNSFRKNLEETSSALLHQYIDQLVVNSVSMTSVLDQLGSNSSDAVELISAYNQALRSVWWTLTGFACAGGLMSLLISQISLERAEEAKEISQPSGASAEMSASTEPIVRTLDGNSSRHDIHSLRPKESAQTMQSQHPSLHPALDV